MTARFDPSTGPIVLPARLGGPTGQMTANLILDTGATGTIITPRVLEAIGCDLAAIDHSVRLTTASAVEEAPLVRLDRLTALGATALGLLVASHSLPVRARVDGVLGLDFFRGHCPTVDFREGRVTLM